MLHDDAQKMMGAALLKGSREVGIGTHTEAGRAELWIVFNSQIVSLEEAKEAILSRMIDKGVKTVDAFYRDTAPTIPEDPSGP